MSIESGASFGLSSTGRVDLGSYALPSTLTHFVWFIRVGDGSSAFGRILGQSTGTHDILCNANIAGTYAFGNVSASNYIHWPKGDQMGQWSSLSISGDTSDTTTHPRIVQDKLLKTTTRVGAGSWWGTLTNAQFVIGNRASDNARNWDGYIAHYCLWDVILTEVEERQLHSGVPPHLVRPHDIVAYYPLDSDLNLFGKNANAISVRYAKINPPILSESLFNKYFLLLPAANNDVIINASVTNLSLSENVSSIQLSNDSIINASIGALVLSSNTSSIQLGAQVNAVIKALVLTPNVASIQLGGDHIISCAQAALSLSENNASVLQNQLINSSVASLVITPQTSSIQQGAQVNAAIRALILSSNTASIQVGNDHIINANLPNLSLAANNANVIQNVILNTTQASISLSGLSCGVQFTQVLSTNVGSLNLSENNATIKLDIALNAVVASLQLSGYNAAIIDGLTSSVRSSQSVDMTLYYSNIAMINYASEIKMDASGENVGLTQ
jgi:hypothetical protein